MAYKIGNVELDNPFLLAPLAGITDAVCRQLAFEHGAAMTYTEMVSAKGIYYGDRKTAELMYIPENAGPTAIQIFGSEPDVMGEAARRIDGLKNVIVDINMGCPVPKVVRNGDGSALLKDPDLVYKVVKATVRNSSKPVTAKIRKGFDDNHINAVEVAQAIEAAGGQAVCVHGRTREQYYSGQADWDIIRQVKQSVSIPVIGNGDIRSYDDGYRMMHETGCDLVMVARGAITFFRPSFSNDFFDNRPSFSTDEKGDTPRAMVRHLHMLCEYKGERVGVKEFRKFVVWYTKGMKGSARLRQAVNYIDTEEKMREVLLSENWQDL